MAAPPISPEGVLPTLNPDGSRRWLRPRLYRGPKWRARLAVALVLMVAFVVIPWLRFRGKPLMLLDVAGREFTLFGRTFLATDGVLLMLLLLFIFIAVVLVSALAGRAWCGWACPQTVYMEFLYRPIERWFEGPRGEKKTALRSAAKYGAFLVLSALLGNAFLSYFVGTDALMEWVRHSPTEHPGPFLVMLSVTALVFLDFAYFREQMCTIACPYARLQSVLLDRRSLVVGYDARRGEPRSKGRAKEGVPAGDCIDCGACVVTCPTGIDIRQGLQMECIACAQCADACDSIMDRIKKPRGLIRYGAEQGFETGKPSRVLRPRVAIYAVLLAVLFAALIATGVTRAEHEVTVLRGLGAPFQMREGLATNQIRIKVQNRDDSAESFRIELVDAAGARLIAPENPLQVGPHARRETHVFVMVDPRSLRRGQLDVKFRVSDGKGFEALLPYKVLGPEGGMP